MDDTEFNAIADALIRRLWTFIPECYREGFDSMAAGGEYAMAVEDLVYLVDEEGLAVPADELRVIRQLATAKAPGPSAG